MFQYVMWISYSDISKLTSMIFLPHIALTYRMFHCCVILWLCNVWRVTHCVLLAILNRMSPFHPPAVGTYWSSSVDVRLNTDQTIQVKNAQKIYWIYSGDCNFIIDRYQNYWWQYWLAVVPVMCNAQVAEERLANMRTVRAFVGEKREADVYNSRVDKVLNLSYKEAIARGIFWAMVTRLFLLVKYGCVHRLDFSIFESGSWDFDLNTSRSWYSSFSY